MLILKIIIIIIIININVINKAATLGITTTTNILEFQSLSIETRVEIEGTFFLYFLLCLVMETN